MAVFGLGANGGVSASTTWTLLCTLFAIVVVKFAYNLYRVRSGMRRLQREGLPMPPHHWLLGHLHVVAGIAGRLPPFAIAKHLGDQVRREYPHLDSAFYLDVWPFSDPCLIALSPEIASQFTQKKSMPKIKHIRALLEPLTGKKDLVTMEGHEWKHWRGKFNPSFSASSVLDLVPTMVEEIRTFKDVIRNHAIDGDIFPLEKAILAMTLDIIGRVVLEQQLHSQTSYNPLTSALLDQMAWFGSSNYFSFLEYFNIVRIVVHRYNTWRMNSYIDPLLKSRFETLNERPESKQILDHVMQSYVKDNGLDGSKAPMDPVFAEFLRSQVKLLLVAGHDTTASSTVYTFHLLQKNPESLRRLREELDSVFGPDVTQTCHLLKKEPQLLNQCRYLLAVTKEALRLHPVGASARFGSPEFFLQSSDGKSMPTEGCVLLSDHYGIHHNPRFWPQADEFVPERHLVDAQDPLYPVRNGWRPFERGPRNCMGQELALVQIRLVIAIVVRDLDIRNAYAENDVLTGQQGKNLCVDGERAYQVFNGGVHPSDHYPCRAEFVQDGK